MELYAYEDDLAVWNRLPCEGCILCCKGSTILIPELGDDLEAFKDVMVRSNEEVITYADRVEILTDRYRIPTKEDGYCIFAVKGVGCLVDYIKPIWCKLWRCIDFVDAEWLDKAVRDRGKELLQKEE
ncbi:MAG: hypothetical protein H7831_10180 [Magnetococcus sp. WYHC-3]